MHKLHKSTGGSNKEMKAQASAWAQPMAPIVIPQVHAPQQQQQQT